MGEDGGELFGFLELVEGCFFGATFVGGHEYDERGVRELQCGPVLFDGESDVTESGLREKRQAGLAISGSLSVS